MNEKTISIDELYNDHLDIIEVNVDKVVTLLQIISGHFDCTEEALRKDEYLAFCYKHDYAEIQSLLFILSDYVWAIKNEMKTVMEVEIAPDEVTA